MKLIKKDKNPYSDQELMSEIALGNREAFSMLFDKYWKNLSNNAYKVLNNRDAAHDIVQELFVELWVKRESLSVEYVSAYLQTAVKYKTLNYIQKHKVKVSLSEYDFQIPESETNSTENNIYHQELKQTLDQSIEKLPPKCSMIFRMSRIECLSNKEIAKHLNISVRTVENQIGIALRILKPKLRKLSIWFHFFLLLLQ